MKTRLEAVANDWFDDICIEGSLNVQLSNGKAKIGSARCSTYRQDLTAQRQALLNLGVQEDRIYTDHGLSGTKRDRPGLEQALAAVREGDTLVVTKLDRLAR